MFSTSIPSFPIYDQYQYQYQQQQQEALNLVACHYAAQVYEKEFHNNQLASKQEELQKAIVDHVETSNTVHNDIRNELKLIPADLELFQKEMWVLVNQMKSKYENEIELQKAAIKQMARDHAEAITKLKCDYDARIVEIETRSKSLADTSKSNIIIKQQNRTIESLQSKLNQLKTKLKAKDVKKAEPKESNTSTSEQKVIHVKLTEKQLAKSTIVEAENGEKHLVFENANIVPISEYKKKLEMKQAFMSEPPPLSETQKQDITSYGTFFCKLEKRYLEASSEFQRVTDVYEFELTFGRAKLQDAITVNEALRNANQQLITAIRNKLPSEQLLALCLNNSSTIENLDISSEKAKNKQLNDLYMFEKQLRAVYFETYSSNMETHMQIVEFIYNKALIRMPISVDEQYHIQSLISFCKHTTLKKAALEAASANLLKKKESNSLSQLEKAIMDG